MSVFADAFHYIALLLPDDADHDRTLAIAAELDGEEFVTTDSALGEVLAYVSGRGPVVRARAVRLVQEIRANPLTKVLPQTRELFDAGLALYAARLDKGYSLTDCMSMVVCRDLGITRVLSHDRHFSQEGLTVLL